MRFLRAFRRTNIYRTRYLELNQSSLGANQRLRFELLGETRDVEHSISGFFNTVQLTDNKYLVKVRYLIEFGLSH